MTIKSETDIMTDPITKPEDVAGPDGTATGTRGDEPGQPGPQPATLTFQDDTGAARSFWIALILFLAIVGWMGSGYLLPAETEAAEAPVREIRPVAVATRLSEAEPVTLYFQAEGQALPDRDTSIRAEASGEVAEVLIDKGADVAEGEVIARLSTTRADADLRRAQEEVDRARREFENAGALLERGVSTQDRVSQDRATFAAAQAQLAAAQEAVDNAVILAPFAGRIETLSLDEGEFISAGTEVGRIVDNRPLTVAIQVPQQSLTRIANGQNAAIRFITGEERTGSVTFVGTSASAETRTFLTEISVPNEDGAIPAGISAEISIPTGEVMAHFVSPSIVSLDPDGRTGVKTVSDGDIVEFHPIQVVRPEIDGIWVTGLPETATLITVGQGFVSNGETVRPTPEEDAR